MGRSMAKLTGDVQATQTACVFIPIPQILIAATMVPTVFGLWLWWRFDDRLSAAVAAACLIMLVAYWSWDDQRG